MISLYETYKQLLEAGGQESGELELCKITLDQAVDYCTKSGLNIPNLRRNLNFAMKMFGMGMFDRSEMPVISNTQVEDFQNKLHTVYGLKSDDRLLPVKDIIPIQKTAYLDKSVPNILKFGVEGTINYLKETNTVMSKDHHLIDGNHRLLCGLIIDPNTLMKSIIFDLSTEKLLELAHTYHDGVGNERNA